MRRFLLIFLLLVMPLQAAWAASSNYCQHEIGAAANHFGHHQHQHQQSDQDYKNVNDNKALFGNDIDCAFCHMNHIGTTDVPTPFTKIFATPTTTKLILEKIDFLISIRAERPERPKWAAAV